MESGDFVTALRATEGGGFVSRVLASPAGEGRDCEFVIPVSRPRLSHALEAWWNAQRVALSPDDVLPAVRDELDAAAATFGADLFQALFTGQTGDLYQRSLGLAEETAGLRLCLRFDPAAPGFDHLHALRWELLREPDAGGAQAGFVRRLLGLSARTPIVRHIETARPVPPPARETLRVLALAATSSQEDLHWLDVDAEIRGLQAACDEMGAEFSCLRDPDPHRLRDELARRAPHVLHFMGHAFEDRATGRPLLLLSDKVRPPLTVSAQELGAKLAGHRSLRLVSLNACNTAAGQSTLFVGLATALAGGGLPAVVAMQDFVSDDGAVAFARAFYQQLTAGATIEAAVVEGRQALYTFDPLSIEWSTPVLFSRAPARIVASPRGGRGALVSVPGAGARLLDAYLGHVARAVEPRLVPPWLSSSPRTGARRAGLFLPLRVRGEPTDAAARWWRTGTAPGREGRHEGQAGTLDVARLLAHEPRMLLLGDAGSGKSTTLRHRAWEDACAAAPAGAAPDPTTERRVPFLVSGRDWAHAWSSERSSRIEDLLAGAFAAASGADADQSRAAVLRILERGGFVVLLDGLDETPDMDSRAALARAVEDFTQRWLDAPWLDTLASRSRTTLTRPWRQIVVAARGHARAILPHGWPSYTLLPLTRDAIRAFCVARQAADPERVPRSAAADRGPTALMRFVEQLDAGGRRVAANPLSLSLLAAAHAQARPLCRSTIFESVVTAWIERAAQRAPESAPPFTATAARAALEALALAMRERGEHALSDAEARALVRTAARESAGAVLAAFGADLGLILPHVEQDGWTFVQRCFEEHLAACALVREEQGRAARLAERLGDAHWADVLPLALARLSVTLDEDAFERALLAWLDHAADTSPRAELLLASAVPELARPPTRVLHHAARRLLAAYGAGPQGPLGAALEGALRSLAEACAASVEGAFVAALQAGAPHEMAAAARAVERLRFFTPGVATALRAAARHENADGSVDRALRALALADAELLPDEPGALRRILVRQEALAARVSASGAWRRVLLAVYGGVPADAPGRGSAMHREAPTLTPLIVNALQAGRAAPSLCADLAAVQRGPGAAAAELDAWLALLALGAEPRPAGVPAGRLAARLANVESGLQRSLPTAVAHALTALGEQARAGAPADLWLDLLEAVLDTAGRRVACASGLVHLAATCPASLRPWVLAALWRATLAGPGDVAYNTAVLLDTQGAALASTPDALAHTLACMAHGSEVAFRHVARPGLERPAVAPEEAEPRLAGGLDVLASLPRALDFAKGWALGRLAPVLARHGLLDEALALALTLSERLGGRRDALARLLPAWQASSATAARADLLDQLLARLRAQPDPYRRFRTGLRLVTGWEALRPSMAGAQGEQRSAGHGSWWRWLQRSAGETGGTGALLPAAAEAIGPANERAWAFAQLARVTRGAARREALERARRATPAISDPAARAWARVRIARALDADAAQRLWQEALTDVGGVADSSEQATLLAALGRCLPDARPTRARWRKLVAELPAQRQAQAQGLHGRLLLEHEERLGGAGAAPVVLAALLDDVRTRGDVGRSREVRSFGPGRAALTREDAQSLVGAWEAGQDAPAHMPPMEGLESGAVAVLEAAREHRDVHVRRRASLCLAIVDDVAAHTLPDVMDWLAATDDDARQRAAGVLGVGRGALRAAALGGAALESVAAAWLDAHDTHPARALVLLWLLERIEHDDAGLLRRWIGATGAGAAWSVLLRNVNSAAQPAWPALVEGLRAAAPSVQRALLQSMATLLARGRLPDGFWPAVASALSALSSQAVGDETFVVDGAQLVASALAPARSRSADALEAALNTYAAGRRRLRDLLGLSAPDLRGALAVLGRIRVAGPHRGRAAEAAARRLQARPAASLATLLAWLERQLGDDAEPDEPYRLLVPDLLAVAAALGAYCPGAVRAAESDLPFLSRRLAEAARLARFYPARADALRLLSQAGRVTRGVVQAIGEAMCDVGPVQAEALASLEAYHEADDGALELLVAGLHQPSAAAAFACARLAAILSRSLRSPAARHTLAREVRALRAAHGTRPLHLWQRVPPDPRRGRWVSGRVGTLGELIEPDLIGATGSTTFSGYGR